MKKILGFIGWFPSDILPDRMIVATVYSFGQKKSLREGIEKKSGHVKDVATLEALLQKGNKGKIKSQVNIVGWPESANMRSCQLHLPYFKRPGRLAGISGSYPD